MPSAPAQNQKVRVGQIVLPPGSPINPATLTISNSLGNGVVSSSGSYQLTVWSAGPQFALVRNAAGHVVMTAFLSDAEPNVTVHSIAGTALFFALSAFTLPSTYQLQMLAQFGTLPGEQNVEGAIATALSSSAADPLGSSQSTIAAAVGSVVTQVRASAPAVARRSAARRAPQGVVFDPTGQVGGLTMIADFPNSVHFENAFRLTDEVYVNETTPYQKSLSTLPLYAIPSVAPLDSFKGQIVDILNGQFALAPVESPVLALPTELGTDGTTQVNTTYQLTAISPGILPAAFSIPADEAAEQTNLTGVFFINNVFIPVVYSIVFPIGSPITDTAFGAGSTDQVRDIISAIGVDAPNALTQISAGNYHDAFLTICTALVSSNSMTTRVMNDVLAGAVASGIPYTEAEALAGMSLASGIAIFDILAGGADFAAVTYAVAHSDQADMYTVVSSPEKVTLTPPATTIRNGDIQALTANALNAAGSGQVLSYAYTNDANFGTLTDGVAGHTNNFNSNSATVTYTANVTGSGTDDIAVTISSRNTTTNHVTTIGSAEATISVDGKGSVTLSPPTLTILPGQPGTLVAAVASPSPTTSYAFQWTNTASAGTLVGSEGANNFSDEPNTGTSNDTVVYHAGAAAGSDTVSVQVFTPGVNTSLGRASATITVNPAGTVSITQSASTLQLSQQATLTATVASPPPNTALDFHWTSTGVAGSTTSLPGTISSGGANNFNDQPDAGIVSDTVNYQASTTSGTDTITVAAYAPGYNGGPQVLLGSASANITVQPSPSPSPSPVPSPSGSPTAPPGLGPPPGEPQSRCAAMQLSAHVVYVGQTITGTAGPPEPQSCGGMPGDGSVTWLWGGFYPGLSEQGTSCGETAATCVFNATGTSGSTWQSVCINGNSVQGGWQSCDYYAVIPQPTTPSFLSSQERTGPLPGGSAAKQHFAP
jgi:hypothetical protein